MTGTCEIGYEDSMLVMTVHFKLKKEYCGSFRARVRTQAEGTLAAEKDCHRFEICSSLENAEQIILYEIYTDEAAFQAHLSSPHFLAFKSDTQDWIESSLVERWDGPWN
jgi:(4S)-4-hydroxy-5-phosphonooxypentane-2,3-dione isomerase